MSKRYVCFRTPNGTPHLGNDDRYAPSHVLAEIGKTAALNTEGRVSWKNFSLQPLEVSLKASVVILDPDGDELNEVDSSQIVWQAILSLIKKAPGKPVRPKDLLAEADKLAAAFFRQPLAKYILVTSLSIADLPTNTVRVRKCVLSSLKARGKAFPLPTLLTHYKSVSPFSRHVDSSQYRLVKVRTIGRSKHEAVHNAMKSVNLLRGLWSLFATYRSWSVTYSNTPQRKPIGVIHTGPIHTLHLPNGALAENDLYWYEPAYTEDQPIFRPADGWQELDKNRRRATRQLSTLKYGGDLEGILIRYVDALDQPDHNIAFLKMWGILERITNSLGTNYDETINRAVWIYSRDNRQLAKDLLQSLRYRRNQYVHSGDSCTESDQVAYMIKFYLDPHLLNLISNPFNVASIEEYGELLSLPTEIDILDNRKAKLSQALRWLRSSNWGS